MKRRDLLGWLALLPCAARADALAALRRGGVAVLLRHAQTEAGIGDPPTFKLGDCSTQRNLDERGRAQSRRIGEWFAQRGLQPARVRSSPWCRCVDTAQLAFGRAEVWAALASTFEEPQRRATQSAALNDALAALPAGGFEVWVTHQVNITALTGSPVAMGQALVVAAEQRVDGATAKVRNFGALDFT